MKELLEPTTRRANEANDLIGKLAHRFENLTTRVEDVEVSQIKMQSKLSIMEEYNKRLMELSAGQTVIESKMQKDKQEFLTHFYSLNSTLNGIQEEVNVFEKERQSIREDLTGISHNLMNAKYDLEQKVAAFKDDYHDRLYSMEDRIRRIELDTDLVTQKVRKNIANLQDVSDQVIVHSRNIEEIHELIKRNEKSTEFNKTESNTHFEILRNANIKLNSELIKVNKSIASIKIHIKSVEDQGTNLSLKLTEPLYQVFPDIPTQKLIASYDLQRFGLKPEEIPIPQIETLKEKAEAILKLEVPPPKPLEDKKKRKKTKKLTSQNKPIPEKPDSEYLTYEEETPIPPKSHQSAVRRQSRGKLNNSSEITEISSITPVLNLSKKKTLKPVQSSENSESSSSIEIIIPEQIDYSPIISKLKKELQEELTSKVKSLSESLNLSFQTLSENVLKIDSDVRDEMKKVSGSVEISIQFVMKKINDIGIIAQQVMNETTAQLINRKRENNDFNFELKLNKEKLENFNKQMVGLIENFEGISNKFSTFLEYVCVGHALQSQDEDDRQSIALMGYKDAKGQKSAKKQVVKVDKQCFSCTGQSSVVINAFKIACLAYAPSSVVFQGEKFTRKELLEYQKKVLESIRGKNEAFFEKRQRAASTTMKNYRPVSVPTQQGSPRSDFIDPELPRILRKSINL
jgi:hypothetical protein